MGEIILIKIIAAVILIECIVFVSVFSEKINRHESRLDCLEAILREFQKDARKNNNG